MGAMRNPWIIIGLIGLLAVATSLVMVEYSKPVQYAELFAIITVPEKRPDQKVFLLDGSQQPFVLHGDRLDLLREGRRMLVRGVIQTHLRTVGGQPIWSFFMQVKHSERL